MGYTVLHLDKASGNDAAMSAHIERTIEPKNADKSRTHFNRELVDFPSAVRNRTEAIQFRIETAGIKRKISQNQVRAVRIVLSGTLEDMKHIEDTGRLNEWCRDNVDWLRKTFGNDNLVSAVLHMDEKTPHIHATVVPIVSGERRKTKVSKPEVGKKKYRKKNPDTVRLCADDVMTRDKLKQYQDSYAELMNKHGLQRGIEGSEARHLSTQQFYRDLHLKTTILRADIEDLSTQKQEVYEKVRDMYDLKDEVRDKFLAVDAHVRDKETALVRVETKLQKARQEYEPYEAQGVLNLIHELFPMMKEQLRIADLCRKIGLGIDSIKELFEGKSLTAKSFSFFSPEHKQKFTAKDVELKIGKEPGNPNKLRLNINGADILEWFKQQFNKLQQISKMNNKQNTLKINRLRM
jgi:hypothetical protein